MDTQFTGTSLSVIPTNNTMVSQDCQLKCRGNSDCASFTWNKTECELWKSTDGTVPKDDYISGPKNCRKYNSYAQCQGRDVLLEHSKNDHVN